LEKLHIYFILVFLLACVALPGVDLEVAQHIEFLRKKFQQREESMVQCDITSFSKTTLVVVYEQQDSCDVNHAV